MKTIALFMIFLLPVVSVVLGSEEEMVSWQSVSLRSQEIAEAGVVSVDAAQAKDGTYQKFVIKAFGRSYSLSADELQRIAGFPLAGLSLRHEAGYPQTGGPTVSARLERNRYDQTAQTSVQEALSIAIPKHGKPTISNRN